MLAELNIKASADPSGRRRMDTRQWRPIKNLRHRRAHPPRRLPPRPRPKRQFRSFILRPDRSVRTDGPAGDVITTASWRGNADNGSRDAACWRPFARGAKSSECNTFCSLSRHTGRGGNTIAAINRVRPGRSIPLLNTIVSHAASLPLHSYALNRRISWLKLWVLAVVSVLGKDQKGVVAQFATYMAERGINIEDIEQRVVRGFFVMDMLVDLKDLTTALSDVITGLLELGRRIDMEVRVHLHGERKKKKAAILVSKEPHCLRQLIADIRENKLHCQVAGVFANHPDLEPIAREANLPFAWKSHDDLPGHFQWLNGQLRSQGADMVVLARYMRIFPPEIIGESSA